MVGVPPLAVVFFGTPEFAVPSLARLIASRHRVAAVVTQPDRPRGRGQRESHSPVKVLAVRHGIPVLQPERLKSDPFLSDLAAVRADLGVVAAYGRLLPDAVLATPRLGLINVHASLLPRYRGAAPIQRAVMAGERETGVTILRVVRELDAGPTFAMAARAIGPDETSDVIERDLADIGATLLLEVVEELAAGRAQESPQDASRATYAPRVAKEDGLIHWDCPARVIHDQVRGLHPWPHAFTFLAGSRYIVLRAAVAMESREKEQTAGAGPPPGTIVEARGDLLRASTGRGGLLDILEIQPEGRRSMTARAFLAGHPVARGAAFTAAAE
jgi:methionyl-tRNA formyltransferase